MALRGEVFSFYRKPIYNFKSLLRDRKNYQILWTYSMLLYLVVPSFYSLTNCQGQFLCRYEPSPISPFTIGNPIYPEISRWGTGGVSHQSFIIILEWVNFFWKASSFLIASVLFQILVDFLFLLQIMFTFLLRVPERNDEFGDSI